MLIIEAANPFPRRSPVIRTPGRGVESGGVNDIWIPPVDGYIVDAPGTVQNLFPDPTPVGRQIDSTVRVIASGPFTPFGSMSRSQFSAPSFDR
jgi:hypothetical protein